MCIQILFLTYTDLKNNLNEKYACFAFNLHNFFLLQIRNKTYCNTCKLSSIYIVIYAIIFAQKLA
jgi:hypothetical protein